MNLEKAIEKLQVLNESHLLDYFHKLATDEQIFLLHQIDSIDIETFFKQQETSKKTPVKEELNILPFTDFHGAGNPADEKLGKEALMQGKMGCLIVAGGQGTRLKLNGPKGMYPISQVKRKSLFQLFAEKTIAASKQVFKPLKIAIMTSPLNHEMTKIFFESHFSFGLRDSQLDLFKQQMLPLLDENGHLFLENQDLIAEGPDGNGSALYNFWHQGIGPKWKSQGIEYVNFVLIDNPLADPFDAELLGFHIRNQNDITIKCVLKNDAEEKVGVLVNKDNKVHVIEYFELSESERNARTENGSLKHACANISLFCISLSFIEKLYNQNIKTPLHVAKKTCKAIGNEEKHALKFEYFIFDILPLADKVQAFLSSRDQTFAPLKNYSDNDSPQTVQAALQNRDRQIYEKIFGNSAPLENFELAQDFYYPTPQYIEKWKTRAFSNDGYLGDP